MTPEAIDQLVISYVAQIELEGWGPQAGRDAGAEVRAALEALNGWGVLDLISVAQTHAQAGEAAAIRGAAHCVEVLREASPVTCECCDTECPHRPPVEDVATWEARHALAGHLLGLLQRA